MKKKVTKIIYTKKHDYAVTKLKEARKEACLTQNEAAKKLGITQSNLSKIESGQVELGFFQVQTFAKVYKKPIKYFVPSIKL